MNGYRVNDIVIVKTDQNLGIPRIALGTMGVVKAVDGDKITVKLFGGFMFEATPRQIDLQRRPK